MSIHYPQADQSLPNGVYHRQLDVLQGPLWPLEKGFGPSSQLIINGTVKPGADRFNIDLVSTKGVAFHFNPRFREDVVVRNSKTENSWDTEERSGVLTLSPGQYFSLAIFCQEGRYQVLVDGQVFTHFQHRHNPLFVTHLRVGGDVTLTGAFYYSKNASYPNVEPPLWNGWSSALYFALDVSNGNKRCLPRAFKPGTVLTIRGTVNPYADRFHLDLLSNQGVAFHFNPRFNEREVVRNSYTNGAWGVEERQGGFPLSGQFFSIVFICLDRSIEVVVDGRQFTHYQHRHDPMTITHLKLDGDAKLDKVCYYPSHKSQMQFSDGPLPVQPSLVKHLGVGYGNNWRLCHGFEPGSKLMLHGIVNPNAHRFHLDLVSTCGVAFHFSHRFDERVVVCNSYTNGVWGVEEREGGLMVSPGQYFSVEFLCQNGGIQVFVNSIYFTTYKHRHDPLTITHLKIDGDAKLHQAIYYPNNNGTTSVHQLTKLMFGLRN